MQKEDINCKPWISTKPPEKILAIRLQALGDTVITLPYLQNLSELYPNTTIDFLTRKETSGIPKSIVLFNTVYALGGGRNRFLIFLNALFLLPVLKLKKYDIIIDLQKNRVSRLIRKALNPDTWSEFDRFSPISAGERTRLTIEATGLRPISQASGFVLKNKLTGTQKLTSKGWNNDYELVVLNPAGFFKTRNWPLDNYISFAKRWLATKNTKAYFLLLGDDRIKEKALFLEANLPENHTINLVNKTSAEEAFAIIQKAAFVLTEDSGLMHMAWTSGIPTLALFGSTRSDWSAPQGLNSLCLHASDLECGPCMAAECKYGDIHCLTRYTPESVFEKAMLLLDKKLKV